MEGGQGPERAEGCKQVHRESLHPLSAAIRKP